MKLHFYADPGHGWLAAPRALLERLALLDKVSTYSYQRGATVYLEEDCDAGLLINALRAAGEPFAIVEHSTDRSSPIRSYESFSAEPPRRPLRANDVVEYCGHRYQLHDPAGPRRGWNVRRLDDGRLFRMKAAQAARAVLVEA